MWIRTHIAGQQDLRLRILFVSVRGAPPLHRLRREACTYPPQQRNQSPTQKPSHGNRSKREGGGEIPMVLDSLLKLFGERLIAGGQGVPAERILFETRPECCDRPVALRQPN